MEHSQDPEPYFLGVDVGGTNIKVGVVSNSGVSRASISVPTQAEKGGEAGLNTICQAAERAVVESGHSMADIAAIGLATPGTMDIPAGMLLEPPNLPGWENFPIRDRVGKHFGKPTILQNDANAAAYGEFWVGAGSRAQSMILWTLGTGIGCGIIIGDVIVEGAHSHGAECGHMIIEKDGGLYCDTGQYGTLEAYAGGKYLVRRCLQALDAGEDSSLRGLREQGEEITPLLMAQAAEQGDRLAYDLILDAARCLGIGTTTLMHTINPNTVLFGGSMTFGRHETELGRAFLQRINDEVQTRAFPVPAGNTTLDYATLGGDAGYIGAAGCARLHYWGNR